jgi:hypothetical protein
VIRLITISACLIVRNEEQCLTRAIDCLKNIAEEIIIVDTGSTDRTKSIAQRYTTKIFDFAWRDDFAAARNFAFSKATMDYIYSADADEIIDQLNQQKFVNLKKSLPAEIDVVQMKYANQLQMSTVYNFDTEYRPKLFKRVRTFNWVDPIHETVDTGVRVFDSEIVVVHNPVALHAERDFSIFRRFARPGSVLSSRLHRLYAQELFIAGTDQDFLSANAYFEWTLHQETLSPDTVQQSQCVVARCCNIKQDMHGLFKVALKNMIGKPSAEVCCELGSYYMSAQEYEEAATWYFTAAFGTESELTVHSSGDVPLQKLSDCYLKLGNKDEAVKYKKLVSEWNLSQPK